MTGGGAAGSPGQQAAGASFRPAARQPATTVNSADLEYFVTIGGRYREMTGIRSPGFTRAPAGAFFEYGYFQYGVPSFSTPGWGLPPAPRAGGPGVPNNNVEPAGEAARGMGPGPAAAPGRGAAAPQGNTGGARGIDLRLLQWMDSERIDGFVNWTAFTHPTLGQVEIGGFKPYAITNPPASAIAPLAESHARFAVYLTTLFSRIRIAKAEVAALGSGVYQISAEVENIGYLPTALAQGTTARAVKPVMVQLDVPPDSIITGNEKTNQISALAGSGNRQSYRWVIKGKPGTVVTLKAVSQKSGTDTALLKLQ